MRVGGADASALCMQFLFRWQRHDILRIFVPDEVVGRRGCWNACCKTSSCCIQIATAERETSIVHPQPETGNGTCVTAIKYSTPYFRWSRLQLVVNVTQMTFKMVHHAHWMRVGLQQTSVSDGIGRAPYQATRHLFHLDAQKPAASTSLTPSVAVVSLLVWSLPGYCVPYSIRMRLATFSAGYVIVY